MTDRGRPADPTFPELWRAHRPRMLDLARRILLDAEDAEEVVQDAFTRLAGTDRAALDDPEGWLVVVTGRLCLDRLRGRRRRPADATDPAGATFGGPDIGQTGPAERVTLVEQVTLAMHEVLERLSPAERTAFVLHDVFGYPFEEVGAIVGRTPAACRQLASRARRTVRAESSTGRFPVAPAEHHRISERFIAACTGGDLTGLLTLLDPSVDGTAGAVAVVGAADVAPEILRYLGPPDPPTLVPLPVGDRIGLVVLRADLVVAFVLLTVEDGRIVHVDALTGAGPRAIAAAMLDG